MVAVHTVFFFVFFSDTVDVIALAHGIKLGPVLSWPQQCSCYSVGPMQQWLLCMVLVRDSRKSKKRNLPDFLACNRTSKLTGAVFSEHCPSVCINTRERKMKTNPKDLDHRAKWWCIVYLMEFVLILPSSNLEPEIHVNEGNNAHLTCSTRQNQARTGHLHIRWVQTSGMLCF